MLRNFSFALFIALSVAACNGCTTVGGVQGTPEVVASQSLSLAESTATAGLVIATDLSKQNLISLDQFKQVVAANKAVDVAVKAGFVALSVKDVNGAIAALQNPDVVNAVQVLQNIIASRSKP